jgi:ATP-dependent NAD(P)H-hydrate dehydratase
MRRALLASLAMRSVVTQPYIPPLLGTFRKGQHGRVVVVGGSDEYTGAPYYAAISSLKTGADLAFVVCARAAASPIKGYSPELIVHPVFGFNSSGIRDVTTEVAMATIVLQRADSVVIGPGLGRDATTMSVIRELVLWTAAYRVPTIIDGDALWMLAQDPSIAASHSCLALTPNAGETRLRISAQNII